ncbi:MAG TPA: hypothetical protein VN175_00735, partial [Rhizomicrobium sp.]|nr:hypothetical protein [Rhizomicrobium sp.]
MQDQATSIDHHQTDRSTADKRYPVGALAANVPTIAQRTNCEEVSQFLNDHPEISAAAIVDDELKVVGMLNTTKFLTKYSRQYSRELYGRKSILKMACDDPLVFDEAIDIANLAASMPSAKSDDLLDGFAITRGGKYLGVGTGSALLRAQLSLLKIHEQELSAALKAAEEAKIAAEHAN